MPVARIITRSETCARQLALDLIARGYAVEVVAPDSVPGDFADLELRVEEDSGNRLVARVEARNGGRSASLDFVHHLRAPLADFEPRAPETIEVVKLPEEPVSSGAGPLSEPVPLPGKTPPLRITIATAIMVSLALGLALGVNRFEKTPTAVPESGGEEIAVPSIDSYSPAAVFENDPPKTGNSTIITAQDVVVKASAVRKTGRSPHLHDDLIAGDTVTYLDASGQPVSKARPAKGLAANTVPYLGQPIPKPAQ